MKIKIVGIIVLMLITSTTIPVVGIVNESDSNPNINKGGIFRQLPSLPGNPMPFGLVSDPDQGWTVYEDFSGLTLPICHIHWWGQTVIRQNETWFPGSPEGMTFDIIFYENNNGEPGSVIFSFEDVVPEYTETGIMYDYPDEWPDGPFELYHFEVDLGLCFDLTCGWVSIFSKYSPTDSVFGWIESPDGNGKLFQNDIERDMDVAFLLAEIGDPEIELSINGGLGVSVEITNIGNETLTNIPVDIVVYGGLLSKTKINKREAVNLNPGDTTSIKSGLFFGLGKIQIGVIADDVVKYTSGSQLLIFTLI
ncbi:hypothetical protein AYK24_10265 [Thermoplasmatales archaeon SG8-52-4]|nr:MAG: hypothetical protein AYK24_10265 [Thermoplasmatales archaeon SG8-52-4]